MPRIDQKLFYANAIKKHGTTARGVAWSDETRQKKRFGAILKALGPGDGRSIVDAGCGFGDFCLYVRERGWRPRRYIGIDALKEMVDIARDRTGEKILQRDILKDPLPAADWYIASGSFNLLTRFETILAIKRCYEAGDHGIIFNLLKGRDKSQTYNYWLPTEIEKACRHFGQIEIYEGYLDGDFTVKITKG